MPVYTYKCRNCDHEFEQRQRMSATPLDECPVCSGELRRIVNSVGIVFKGSGFYVTDNRNGSTAGKNGSSAGAPQKKEKEETKSESTSEKSEGSAKVKESAPAKS